MSQNSKKIIIRKKCKIRKQKFSFLEQKGNDYNRIPPPIYFTFSDEDNDNTFNKIKRNSNIISNATPPRDFNGRKFEFLRTGLASTICNQNNQRLITNRFSSFSLPVSSTNSVKKKILHHYVIVLCEQCFTKKIKTGSCRHNSPNSLTPKTTTSPKSTKILSYCNLS